MLESEAPLAIAIIGLATAIGYRAPVSAHMPRAPGSGEPNRVPFECVHVCEACRRMQRASPNGPCPACGGECWLDTQLVEMTEFLRASEAFDQEDAPVWAVVGSWVIVAAIAAAGVAFSVTSGFWNTKGSFADVEEAVIFAVFAGMFAWVTHWVRPSLAWGLFRLVGGRGRTDRWFVPLGLALEHRERGLPELHEPLTAPLSGRPCVAWLLTAHLRQAGGRQWRRVLIEHRSAPLEFNGRSFATDQFGVDARPKRYRGAEGRDETRVLRERGLLLADGDYVLREAIVPLDVIVTSRNHAGPNGGFSAFKLGRAVKKRPGGAYRA